MRLLERETQLGALRDYAADAARGDGRLVLVAGEAGIGKSSLVEAFVGELPEARVAWCVCDGAFTPSALGPLRDVADQWGGAVREVSEDSADRDGRFAALLGMLRGHPGLSVLVLEDLHFADEATLDLVGYLARRLREVRAVVVATYRDDGLADNRALREALGEVATQRAVRRIALPPLTVAAVSELATGSGREAGVLHAVTGGNPFFVSELLHGGTDDLPASARDAVLARAGRLSAEGRAVLDAAALIGGRVDQDLLAAVVPDASSAIDEPVVAGLLVADGPGLRFRHEIARMAVEQEVGPHAALQTHRRILLQLTRAGVDDDARLAHHAEGAGDAAAVVMHARRAGDRSAALSSRREAVAQYRRALRYAESSRPRAELLTALAQELVALDMWAPAADALEEAVELWEQLQEPRREGEARRRLGAVYWRACRGPESVATIRRAREVLEPVGPSHELAAALLSYVSVELAEGSAEGAIALTRRALEMSETLGLTDLVSQALNTLSAIAYETGQGEDWQEPLRRSLDVALANQLPLQAAFAYTNLQEFTTGTMRYAEAERWYREGAAYCDEHDLDTWGLCLAGGQALVLASTGRWDEVESISAGPLGGDRSSPINRVTFLVPLALSRARTGVGDAWAPLEEAAASTDALGEAYWAAYVRAARAEVAWLAGDPALAETEIAAAAAHAADAPVQRATVALQRFRITGEVDPDAVDLPAPHAAELKGDVREAVRLWDDVGRPYDAAMALLGSCDVADLREALPRFEALGAPPAAALARRRLRAAGVRVGSAGPRPATRQHPDGLTVREQEVLTLIAEGLSDQAIADRLVISPRTVHHHVAALLAKLGVASRKEAAVRATS
jgi:DNA-binding CsgD family transcriptional regulator/tetratricopeptide (TPR) repeat protein